MLWFTSDWHFGHQRILELGDGRPFKSLSHMHETIRGNVFRNVSPTDTLYILGDGAMGSIEHTINLYADLPGEKEFRPGNHDKIFEENSKAYIEKFLPLYINVGLNIGPAIDEIYIDVDGEPVKVLISHFPYLRSSSERHAKHHPINNGLPLIHGHTHSRGVRSDLPNEYHVGVDAHNFAPVPETEIVNWLRELKNTDKSSKRRKRNGR